MVIWQKHECLTPQNKKQVGFLFLFCFVFSDKFILIPSHLCVFKRERVCVRERESVIERVCVRERVCISQDVCV